MPSTCSSRGAFPCSTAPFTMCSSVALFRKIESTLPAPPVDAFGLVRLQHPQSALLGDGRRVHQVRLLLQRLVQDALDRRIANQFRLPLRDVPAVANRNLFESTLPKPAPEMLPCVPPARCRAASSRILRPTPTARSPRSESRRASDIPSPAARSARRRLPALRYVDPPTCGVRITLSSAVSGEFFNGSSTNTSSAAAATCFCLSASARSASFTSSPRAQFTSRTPFFIFAIDAALIMPVVCGVRPTCSVM